MAVIPRRADRVPRLDGVRDELRERAGKWYTNKRMADEIKVAQEGTKDQPGLRPWLLDRVRRLGAPFGDKGHRVLKFDPPIGDLYGLKAQRGLSFGFDSVAALTILQERGGDELVRKCTRVDYAFDEDKMDIVVGVLKKAGVLQEVLADGYPQHSLDPDRIREYHQRNKDILTEADLDAILPDEEKWSLIALNTPVGELADAD